MPTYETATTRHFYHGRTETVRSCTDEAIALAKALVEKDKNDDKVKRNAYFCDLCISKSLNFIFGIFIQCTLINKLV